MWKVIGSILAVTIIVLFISFNIENKSDISFIVYTIYEIPVYLTIFISLLIGVLAMLPFALGFRGKKKKVKSVESLEQEINSTFDKKFSDTQNTKKKKKRSKKKDDISDLDIGPTEPLEK